MIRHYRNVQRVVKHQYGKKNIYSYFARANKIQQKRFNVSTKISFCSNDFFVRTNFYLLPFDTWFVCLFVDFCPTPEFALILRRHNYRSRAANCDLYSALMVIEQWGIFSVPNLLWHGVYNGGAIEKHYSPIHNNQMTRTHYLLYTESSLNRSFGSIRYCRQQEFSSSTHSK